MLGVASVAASHDSAAQSPEVGFRPTRVTGYLGAGNAYGGVGGAIEPYVVAGRLSVFAAAGYFPTLDECSGHARPAFGIRAYTRAEAASLYGELFLGVVRQRCILGGEGVSDLDRDYGLGVSVGYRLWRSRHLVLHGSIGLGWAPDLAIVRPLVAAGVGYRLP